MGGETRHINSAFFTFQLEDQSVALPQLLLETQVHNLLANSDEKCISMFG